MSARGGLPGRRTRLGLGLGTLAATLPRSREAGGGGEGAARRHTLTAHTEGEGEARRGDRGGQRDEGAAATVARVAGEQCRSRSPDNEPAKQALFSRRQGRQLEVAGRWKLWGLQLRLRAGRSSEGFAADGSSEEGLRDPLAGEEGEHIEHVPCRDARGRRTGGRRDGVVELCTRKVQGVG
jgi:hypothetical protein